MCPKCGWWVARVDSAAAKFEVNCAHCRAPLIISRNEGRMAVEVSGYESKKSR
jgi:hypothetical protein